MRVAGREGGRESESGRERGGEEAALCALVLQATS